MPELAPTPVPATSAPSPYTGRPRVVALAAPHPYREHRAWRLYGLIFRLSVSFISLPVAALPTSANPAAS